MRDTVSMQQANLSARYSRGVWHKPRTRVLRWAATLAIGFSLAVLGLVLVTF